MNYGKEANADPTSPSSRSIKAVRDNLYGYDDSRRESQACKRHFSCERTSAVSHPANGFVSCLSWKWRERSSVKIAERTYEEGKKALHRRGEGGHSEAPPFGQGSGLGPV